MQVAWRKRLVQAMAAGNAATKLIRHDQAAAVLPAHVKTQAARTSALQAELRFRNIALNLEPAPEAEPRSGHASGPFSFLTG